MLVRRFPLCPFPSIESTETDEEHSHTGCTFEEYNRCEKCSKIWNRVSHRFGCIDRRCRGTPKPPSIPPLVNKKTCRQCRIQLARQRCQKAPEPRRSTLATSKVTPLFWDADGTMLGHIWSAEDPTLTKEASWKLGRRNSHQSLKSVDSSFQS